MFKAEVHADTVHPDCFLIQVIDGEKTVEAVSDGLSNEFGYGLEDDDIEVK